jgi:uncharacterized protein (UPF0210 family)
MKIRSITSFYDPGLANARKQLLTQAAFVKELTETLTGAGFEVQSKRLATSSFTRFPCPQDEVSLTKFIKDLEAQSKEMGFAYLSCGPALPTITKSFEMVPHLLAETKDVFLSAIISDSYKVYPEAVQATARIIQATSTISHDGFANLRFAALANVNSGAPFLPAAYHRAGAHPGYAIALECADVVLKAFNENSSLEQARKAFLNELQDSAEKLTELIISVEGYSNFDFFGFDFSPAPFPEDWCSLAGAIEAVGKNPIGSSGSLAAAAVIADTLDQGKWKRTGFNGLMLPVLEDSVLAGRSISGELSIKDLLLYSTVCGTGLDTVPLEGDTPVNDIAALLMDIGALSVRLGKPLTARLMPLPGKKAGDKTHFDFGFFADGCVLPLSKGQVQTPLMGNEPVLLAPRHTYRAN